MVFSPNRVSYVCLDYQRPLTRFLTYRPRNFIGIDLALHFMVDVQADQLDFTRNTQHAETVQNLRYDQCREKTKHEEHDQRTDKVTPRRYGRIAFERRGWVTPKHEPGHDD